MQNIPQSGPMGIGLWDILLLVIYYVWIINVDKMDNRL